jgi:predicted lipoprotein with Yx(FWY)xxD motif
MGKQNGQEQGCARSLSAQELAAGWGSGAGRDRHRRGVQPSLLGTVKDANGSLEVTYNGWPLYTFTGDSGPDTVKGEGITGFGGTWYVLNASGNPVTSS